MGVRRALITLALAGAVVGSLIGLVGGAAANQDRWPGWLDILRRHSWESFAALALGAALVAVMAAVQVRRESVGEEYNLEALVDRLAIGLRRQWLADPQLCQLNDPYALPVRWDPADPALFATWTALVKLATSGAGWSARESTIWAASPADLAGSDNDFSEVLDRIPTRRLVVLGEPGAGKTTFLARLTLGLLASRPKGGAVPIMMPLASWNPADNTLREWMIRWLAIHQPALASPISPSSQVTLAQALLDGGLLLPILDGLDEIPKAARGMAIYHINEAMRPGWPLVLSSRTLEFREALRPPAGVEAKLVGATGVHIRPIDPAVVLDYLQDSAGGPNAAARWSDVRSAVAANPEGPVAQALTTPLMAVLARAVYNPRLGEELTTAGEHPSGLLSADQFGSREKVEQHLFDAFVPGVYRAQPGYARQRWPAVKAERWLTFLARDLEQRQGGTTELAWWALAGAAPNRLDAVAVGFVAALAVLLGFPVAPQGGSFLNFAGYGFGLIVAVCIGMLVRRWLPTRRRAPGAGILSGLVGGLLGSLLGLSIIAKTEHILGAYSIGAALAGGIAVGLGSSQFGSLRSSLIGGFAGTVVLVLYEHSRVFAETRLAIGDSARYMNAIGIGVAAYVTVAVMSRRFPARGLRWSPLGLLGGVIFGLTVGVAIGIQVGPVSGVAVGIIGLVAGAIVGAVFEVATPDLAKSTGTLRVYFRDRATFLLCIGLAAPMGVSFGFAAAIGPDALGDMRGAQFGLSVGLASFVVGGLALAFIQTSWGAFVLARLWLALSGRLPWRLIAFLDDAHRTRGVLRQIGAVYEFRHADLQRHLAYKAIPNARSGVAQRRRLASDVSTLRAGEHKP